MDFSVRHFVDTVKTHDSMSAKGIVDLWPEEIFADWDSVHVNVAEKANHDVTWSAIPTEADAWIRALY